MAGRTSNLRTSATFAFAFAFYALCICLTPTMSHAKECTNIPTQRISHTLRSRGLAKNLAPFSSLSSARSQPHPAAERDGATQTLMSSPKKFTTLGGPDGRAIYPDEVRKAPPMRQRSSADEDLADEVLLDIDDWGTAWVTLTKSLLKNAAQQAKPRSAVGASDRDEVSQLRSRPDAGNGTTTSWHGSAEDFVFRRAMLSAEIAPAAKSSVAGLLKDVSLHKVRLGAASPQFVAQNTNLQYLLELDVDNMAWNFRVVANLEAPGRSYGGWESPQSELRGHFVGHYLSATALMWASTHDEAILKKMNSLVKALKECQKSIGTGYLSAFPSEFFDRFEAIQYVWAPYYTIHKIMAGLLDQYTLAGSKYALDMVVAMADYFNKRVKSVIERFTIERHWRSLNEETGGMNDVLYRLYSVTGDEEHLKLAHLFDKPCFLGPLALQVDHLSGFHSNTHIPIVVGAQMRYEITGDPIYRGIAEYFMSVVNSSHSYATGGTSVSEFWTDPMRQGGTLHTENQETCTTYNMLKIARTLFRWTKNLTYMDYYERALVNGVLGVQRGQQPGVMIYMLPLGPGTSKARSYHGWGNKFDSFWCCYGSAIESFAKLGDSVYFEDDDGETPAVYVAQFVSSDFTWDAAGLLLRQSHKPVSSEQPTLEVTLSFCRDGPKANTGDAAVHIRIPAWISAEGCHVYLNGKEIGSPSPGNFFSVVRAWETGDELVLMLPMSLRTEGIQDDRSIYSTTQAIMFGPFVMAGVSTGDWKLGRVGDPAAPSEWTTPIPAVYSSQLYTFTQEHVAGGQYSGPRCMAHANGSAFMSPVPLDGTDQAGLATFRAAAPIALDVPETGHGSRAVSLELFSEPGRFLVHNGRDGLISVADHFGAWGELPVVGGLSARAAEGAVFWFLPGLTGTADTASFEAVSEPGCFLSSEPDGGATTEPDGLFLRCKASSGNDKDFDATSTFGVGAGLASYHPLSFVAKSESRTVLLAPLNSFRDESYTTYFEIR